MSESIYDIPVETISGDAETLNRHKGEVLLIVNVASQCGLTPQYEGLENLYETYKDRNFSVLGFPANDFAGQEPGSNEEIAQFCESKFGIKFPMFSKIPVTGEGKHPLYRHLISAQPETPSRERMAGMLRGHKIEPTPAPEVLWNFEKFLVNREGEVVARFAPDTAPDAPELVAAIEAELG